ncbi:MAG: VOC family protein [Hyphomicrobiaceae bacterium]
MPATNKPRAHLISCMSYPEADAAVAWLQAAFGFAPHAVYRDGTGKVVHAELTFANGMIMIGPVRKEEFGERFMILPTQAGGKCTQTVYAIVDDVDLHHDRAKAAGAEIVMAPADQDYGGRLYSARDIGGHIWSFGSYDPWKTQTTSG